jgi:hypothetical protein
MKILRVWMELIEMSCPEKLPMCDARRKIEKRGGTIYVHLLENLRMRKIRENLQRSTVLGIIL